MTYQPRSQSTDEFSTDSLGEGAEAVVGVLFPAETRNVAKRPPETRDVLDVDATAGGPRPGVAAALGRELAAQRRLCDALEAIADALPNDLDAQRTLHVARSIGPSIRRAHRFEEDTVFPLLKTDPKAASELSATLERLHFEHWEDESFGDELAEKLIDYVRTRAAGAPGANGTASPRIALQPFPASLLADLRGHADPVAEALGYMLRGFFEGLRRHIAFEEEHLVPLLASLGAR